MADIVYAREEDEDRTIGVTLSKDGQPLESDGETFTMRMDDEAGTVHALDPVVGEPGGVVVVEIPDELMVAGRWLLDWKHHGGLVYPGDPRDRIQLVIERTVVD